MNEKHINSWRCITIHNLIKEVLDNENKQIMIIKDEEIHLTKTEYAILKQLLLNPKQVVTKSKLLELISEDTLDCDENSLKVHISNIKSNK